MDSARNTPSSKAVVPSSSWLPRLEFDRHQSYLQVTPIKVNLKVSTGRLALINQTQSHFPSMGGFALARLSKVVAAILCMCPTACTEFQHQTIMHSKRVRPVGFNLPNEINVALNIVFVVLNASSDEVDSNILLTNTIGTFKVQERFEVRHAFTHGHLKSTPSALVRRCEAMTS